MILLAIFLEKNQSNQTDLLYAHIHTQIYLDADTLILENRFTKLYCSAVLGKLRRNRFFFQKEKVRLKSVGNTSEITQLSELIHYKNSRKQKWFCH